MASTKELRKKTKQASSSLQDEKNRIKGQKEISNKQVPLISPHLKETKERRLRVKQLITPLLFTTASILFGVYIYLNSYSSYSKIDLANPATPAAYHIKRSESDEINEKHKEYKEKENRQIRSGEILEINVMPQPQLKDILIYPVFNGDQPNVLILSGPQLNAEILSFIRRFNGMQTLEDIIKAVKYMNEGLHPYAVDEGKMYIDVETLLNKKEGVCLNEAALFLAVFKKLNIPSALLFVDLHYDKNIRENDPLISHYHAATAFKWKNKWLVADGLMGSVNGLGYYLTTVLPHKTGVKSLSFALFDSTSKEGVDSFIPGYATGIDISRNKISIQPNKLYEIDLAK